VEKKRASVGCQDIIQGKKKLAHERVNGKKLESGEMRGLPLIRKDIKRKSVRKKRGGSSKTRRIHKIVELKERESGTPMSKMILWGRRPEKWGKRGESDRFPERKREAVSC